MIKERGMPDRPGDNTDFASNDRRSGHPDPNELARLVDQGPDAVEPWIVEHLAHCESCRGHWAEAARYRGARVLEGENYPLPENLAALAQAMELPGARDHAVVHKTSRRFWRPAPTLTAGGALLAAVLALVLFFPRLHGGGDTELDPSRSAIFSHLESLSGWGMVYPGATGGGDSGRPVYRSGDGIDRELLTAIDAEETRWRADVEDPDAAWWLAAGYASAGRLGLASDLVHQALRLNPDHVGLLHLQAITAWQLSEFDRAELALQHILAQAPADSVALFNLALVQMDTDRTESALPVLHALAAGSTNHLLQERAREVLAE